LFVSSLEPLKVEQVLGDLDWVVAMQEELNNFERNQVWTVDIWERNKELIRKRTDIGEHFTREIIQSIVFIFYH